MGFTRHWIIVDEEGILAISYNVPTEPRTKIDEAEARDSSVTLKH